MVMIPIAEGPNEGAVVTGGSVVYLSFMKRWIFFFFIIASALAFGQGKPYPKAQTPAATGQIAPDFTLKDQDGKDFRLSDQRRHWVLLYFYRGYW
jgi:cytochrome oxidase Cu insertion factor (SCO1/SenC/PrrC family)